MINTKKISHLEKRISESKRKKENRIDSFSIARNNGIARKFKKEFSLHFYSPRVCRMTSSVKTSRDTLHRGSAHAEKK